MKISDLDFEAHPVGMGATKATVMFGNGFGASVITGNMFYTSDNTPYEIAVLDKSECVTYSTPITSDVLGYLTEEAANNTLADIEALEPL